MSTACLILRNLHGAIPPAGCRWGNSTSPGFAARWQRLAGDSYVQNFLEVFS
jgi:hypothetical protein